ncbi:MAG: DUF3108 domain-containing protein [Burkholderiales bacterium]|nr:DUF3108 domain-containing protein [Burkholderiales bacterium]
MSAHPAILLRPTPARWQCRRSVLLGAIALVLLLHFGVIGSLGEIGAGARAEPALAEPVAVRTIEALPARVAEAAAIEPAASVGPVALSTVAPAAAPTASPAASAWVLVKASARLRKDQELSTTVQELPPAEPTSVAASPPTEAAVATSIAMEPSTLAAAERETPEAGSEPGMMTVALAAPRAEPATFLTSGERPPPVYRTLLPGPATLGYELRRGPFRGAGEIRWRPAGDRYALQFDVRLAGIALLSQSSQGELGAHGLAPVRFVDQRPRKSARAANFSRDSGAITFSGSSNRWPLFAGTQDRLSWMIQLGGIVAADPALATGGRISMVLVSARGEAAVRTARFAGRENAETASGSVAALKFVVDGHSAYDGSFEIWLDPARAYLPARAISRNGSGDAEFELLLQRAEP